ncbi:DUF6538 domain-containing protein [Paracoccus sp. SCSIO 75233]|uniref:DUF6538 domain-containing protein n=1 Tax=Paracoccus sp. SCSIO 75233 TaxID=3017782 RepID=UPI00349FDF9F
MPRPQKHPKTGIYYYRQRVPVDLHGQLGNKTVTRSLRTKTCRWAIATTMPAPTALQLHDVSRGNPLCDNGPCPF